MINEACLYDYQIAHTRDSEGYKRSWYDVENADENFKTIYVTIPEKSGDLYFTVESYYRNMVPSSCTTGTFTSTDSNAASSNSDKPLVYFSLYNSAD